MVVLSYVGGVIVGGVTSAGVVVLKISGDGS